MNRTYIKYHLDGGLIFIETERKHSSVLLKHSPIFINWFNQQVNQQVLLKSLKLTSSFSTPVITFSHLPVSLRFFHQTLLLSNEDTVIEIVSINILSRFGIQFCIRNTRSKGETYLWSPRCYHPWFPVYKHQSGNRWSRSCQARSVSTRNVSRIALGQTISYVLCYSKPMGVAPS